MSNASEGEELRGPSPSSLSSADPTPLAPVTVTATESNVSLNSLEVQTIMENSNSRQLNAWGWGWDLDSDFTPRSASFLPFSTRELSQSRNASTSIQEMFDSVRPEQEGMNPTSGFATPNPETDGNNGTDSWRVAEYDSADDNDLTTFEEDDYNNGTEPSLLLMEVTEVGPGHSATSGCAGGTVANAPEVGEPDPLPTMDPTTNERYHRAIRTLTRTEIMTRTMRNMHTEIAREADRDRPFELPLDEDEDLAEGVTEIKYGNRSFEPLSSFNKAASKPALPAKPGVSRFNTCDEKAEAARQVYNTLQSNVVNDAGGLLAYSTDVFNHFWSETNVIDPPESSYPTPTPTPGLPAIPTNAHSNRTRSRRSNSSIRRNFGSESGIIDFGRIMTSQEYEQWDLETSTTMDASLWNDLSIQQSSTRIGNPSFDSGIGNSDDFNLSNRSTVGVGTGEESEADVRAELSSTDEDSPREAEFLEQSRARRYHRGRRTPRDERHWHGRRDIHERNLSPPTREFYRSIGLIVDNGDHRNSGCNASPFTLDVPPYPRRINRPRENSPRPPRSFLQPLSQDRGDGNIYSVATTGNSNNYNNEGGDDEPWKYGDDNDSDDGESVFPRVPQADATPSALFSEMIEQFEQLDLNHGQQQQQLPAASSNRYDIDEIFFILEQPNPVSGNGNGNHEHDNAERRLETRVNAPLNCESDGDDGHETATFDREE